MHGETPDHVREAAQTIDELRAQRRRQLPASERAVQRMVERVGRPRFIIALAVFIVAWVAVNSLLRASHASFDDRGFSMLNTFAQLCSLLLVVSVLSHQNTQSTLEQERARLMLQMMVIHDRKITEALNAVEDLRREHPRIDTSDGPNECTGKPTFTRQRARFSKPKRAKSSSKA